MIGRLSGRLVAKQAAELLLDVQGVGYEVMVPLSLLTQLPELGEPLILHTHLQVREDAHQLYGFAQTKERQLFRLLIKVNGVGPKLALAVLSAMQVDHFVSLVEQQDVSALVRLPGVGKKTAERLVIEMRDRLKGWSSETKVAGSSTTVVAEPQVLAEQDAQAALVSLGYSTAETQRVLNKLRGQGLSSEDLIRQALQQLFTPK